MDATRPLTQQECKATVREAREVQAAEGLSNAAIARVIGCSPATWSQIKGGKYKGNTEDFCREIRSWLGRRAVANETPPVQFVRTSVSDEIWDVCDRAWRAPTIARVVTRSGMGKTCALVEYARKFGAGCAYVYAGQMMSSPGPLLAELARKLNVSAPAANPIPATLYRVVRERLAGMYSGGAAASPLILIDEATTLQARALNALRNLHDEPSCRAAIVLADTYRLEVELKSRRREALAGGYEQLASRSNGAVYRLGADEPVVQADVTAVARSVLAGLGFSGRLSPRSAKFLRTIAEADGGLRNVANRLQVVCDVARQIGCAPTYSVLELDYVAPLVGANCTQEHPDSPFGAPEAAAARRAG